MAASNVELRSGKSPKLFLRFWSTIYEHLHGTLVVSQEDLITIRDIIIGDPIALQRWSLIVNYVVDSKTEELRITKLITNGGYEEAVLQTLRCWYSSLGAEGTLQAFVEVLRRRGLVTVAG